MTRSWLIAAMLLCASLLAARAQGDVLREVKAPPGRDVRVGIFLNLRPDCTSGPLPAIRLVDKPAHGAVRVKRGTLKATNFKQCLATEVPALVAYYRSAADFKGTDEFALEISYPSGHKQTQHIRINVSDANPDINIRKGGQGI